jgi:membrane-bound metal-dependent hydrolase YbcI (DUF457 family)
MPSPVGHAIAGLTVHALAARGEADLLNARRLALLVFTAIAPDLDLLVKFVDGRNHHQQESHSIAVGLLVGLAAAAWLRVRRHPGAGALGLALCLAWLSHIGLDYLNRDTNPPIGVMAFWPLSADYYKFPWPIFLDVGRELSWEALRNNVLAAAWEALVLLPVFSFVWRRRLRRLGR